MDVLLHEIGTAIGRDYSTVTLWEAARDRPDLGAFFNVGALYHDSDFQGEYESFLTVEHRLKAEPQFVLMDETGVVLASRIAGRFHTVHDSFPPQEPIPYSIGTGFDPEPIVGVIGDRNVDPVERRLLLEEIARTYIHQRLDEYDKSIDRSEVQILFKNTYQALARLIQEQPSHLDDVEWRELEKLLKEVLSGIGYSVTLTPASKDGGKDLILECRLPSGTRTYFIEVKHWRSKQKVGAKVIKDFYRVVVREKVHGGLFLSTYGVADNAFEQLTEVERRMIRIGTKSTVVALCKSYLYSKRGVILPSTELPNYLFAETVDK
ncbi:MAG: restriction endonuclease [Planctomycetes bacterium]|nr:restriction endonuclease [Planctomycetota bacterium]